MNVRWSEQAIAELLRLQAQTNAYRTAYRNEQDYLRLMGLSGVQA